MDLEVNYLDFRDASGEIIEVGDSAGIRANTGSVSLDRTVYPVPFGEPANFAAPTTASTNPVGRSVFPVHQTGAGAQNTVLDAGEFIPAGDLTIHIRVNDPDSDISPDGEDFLSGNTTTTSNRGLVKISVIRGANSVVLGYGGSLATVSGIIDVGGDATNDQVNAINQFGPIKETAPDSGVFELDLAIQYTDGPSSVTCPTTLDYDSSTSGTQGVGTRFDDTSNTPVKIPVSVPVSTSSY